MEPVPSATYVRPNPRIPKVLGILNIVFASALMICGLCTIGSYALTPVYAKMMTKVQQDLQTKQEASRKAILEGFDEEEEAATSDEAKAEVVAKRKRFEAEPRPPQMPRMDLAMFGMEGPVVRYYVWAEFVSGVGLNLLLLAAGIGLVMRKPWGIKLGLSVAVLKILRLVLVYGYAALVIVPKVAVGMVKIQMQTMGQQLPPGQKLPADFGDTITKVTIIWYTACAVMMILVGSIYPVVSLWLLSRPSARAACSDLAKSQEPADSW